MFHWTDFTQPREGTKKLYPDAVEAFDVNAFASLLEEMGAGYVVFTLNHAHPHCPAPIHAWEAVHPGWTTRRDLIGDIADAFGRKLDGIDFNAIDSKPVHYFFLIVAPPLEVSNQYLPVLGKIAQFAKEPDVPAKLAMIATPKEFLKLLEDKNI